jgi:cell division protein FtsQ
MAAKKKKQARRKQPFKPGFGWLKPALALLTVAGSIGGLLLLATWMQDPQQWPVRAVGVKGELRHLQREELTGTVAPLAVAGFFAVDVSSIQQRIERIPWVDQVSVRRAWPDRLVIQVREQQPVARWGESAYLNPRAQVFRPLQRVDLPGLPKLQGPEGYQQRVLAMHGRMQDMLAPLKLEIVGLRLDDRRSWRVALSNGLDIEVGRTEPLERVARFVRFYPAILAAAGKSVEAVDLRYSNGFAVHWQQSETQTSTSG